MSNTITSSPAFQEWMSEQDFLPVGDEKIRQAVVADIDFGKSMSQQEYTLWQTWQQIQNKFGDANEETLKKIRRAKRKIWRPKDPDDYLNLEPELVLAQHQFPIRRVSIWGHERFAFLTNPDPLSDDWEMLRHFVASMAHGGNVGRSLRFLIRDRSTKKYLGILCLSGDFLDLSGRDAAIGWSKKVRVDQRMIEHTAIGSVIIPMQPFGYNYLGGKLLSLLLVSDAAAETWEQIYGQKLAGVTTTALYGREKGATQYDGLKYWKKYGYTTGSTVIRPTLETAAKLKDWMLNMHPEEYFKYYHAKRDSGLPLERDANERARQFCYRKLGIKSAQAKSNHERAIYFSRIYDNSFEFLRKEVNEEKLKPRFDNSVESLVDLWKTKYASKRVRNLVNGNRFSQQFLYYDELIGLSWAQTKEQYLQ